MFSVNPMLIDAYLFGLMNRVLANGLLKEPWIMGTPLLITIHTFIVLILFLIMRRNLLSMVKPDKYSYE